MRAKEFDKSKDNFMEMFRKFLPLAMKIIELRSLPKMVFLDNIGNDDQPTFGSYVNDEQTLYVALANRHPNDILRTIAHELTHFKQDTEHELHADSGETGSKHENQANAIAGIVMRNFNKMYPEYLRVRPIVLESWSQQYKSSINCNNPKGFSQRAHCQGRKKNESIEEKLNRTGSNELVIFDIDDTLLHTTAKINVIDTETGKPKLSLTNQQFNNYKLNPGEEFDFGEFRDAAKFEEESVPIGPMLDKLKSDLAAGKNVVMLTARADFDNQKAVWRTFKKHGIDINTDVHLYRAGNQPGAGSPAVKKAIHVNDWLKSGNYNKVVMYDDSEKNLSVFKSLEKRFPDVSFEAHHVSEKGDTTQVESAGDRGDIPTGPGQQLIPFPKGTTMVDVSDIYDWYKLGMVISDLDDADPKMFGQGAPHTVIAFGSEEEEHKLLPLLKKLGLTVHDIDRPEDVKKAIPAKMFANDLAETIRKVKGGYRLIAKSGRNLGTYPTHAGAEKREKQVQYFKHVGENFANGRNPQDKGDSARHGIRKGMTIAQLKKVRSSDSASPRKKQLAHWQINMRQGRKK